MLFSLLASIPYDLFTFGPFELPFGLKIHSFGLMVALGLMLTFTLTGRKAEQRMGMSSEHFQNYGIYAVVIGWCFAHVFNVIFYEPEKVLEDPIILLKVWGSISSYGGLFGGIIATYIFHWRHPEVDMEKLIDIGAYAITFPWMFGRIGCATVHDHPGHETDFFLGIEWTDGVVRHDLGFYEALWWMVIVAVVLWTDRKPRPKGFYVVLVALMYAPARFGLDFLRVPVELGGDIRYLGLTPAQYFSIGIFGVGLYWYFKKVRHRDPMEWEAYDPERDPNNTGVNRIELDS